MKKFFCKILIFTLIFGFLYSCEQNEIESVSLDKTIAEINVGESIILQLTILPESTIESIEWSSSDTSVAAVVKGIVTGIAEGSATISASAGNKSASCLVFVYDDGSHNLYPGENVDKALRLLPKSEKRGVSFSFSLQEDVTLLSPATSWSYNWGPAPADVINTVFKENQMDFFPMAWNGGYSPDKIRAYKAENPHCEYILGFNEPNLTDQCNYTPAQAAEFWPGLKALADELNMKLISPAMNYGTLAGYSDPIKWLDEFFSLIPLSDVDGIAIHCYMSNAGGVKSYINMFKKYGKPIWMTEFCAWDGGVSPTSQMNYMCEIINYMEADPDIVRYAWFIPRASGNIDTYPYMQLLTKTQPFQLSALGRVFVGLSSQDKLTWQSTENHILAQTYSSISTVESLTGGNFVSGPHLRPTTDTSGDLELCDFYNNNWVEYQIENKENINAIRLRYSNFATSECEIWVDGVLSKTVELTSTTDPSIWNTKEDSLNIPSGKHTVRIKVTRGNICLNWIKFN